MAQTHRHFTTWLLVLLIGLNCAGSSNPVSDSGDDSGLAGALSGKNQTDDTTVASDVVMSFQFALSIYPENTADFGDEINIALDRDFELPMSVGENGKLAFYAPEFPTIIYRICSTQSTSSRCDLYSDIEGLVDMDLVFDACDRLVKDHAECGAADDTLYEGELDASGNLNFDNIAIRTRLFFVTTSGSSGYTATPTMPGSIDDLSRISLDLTTFPVTVSNDVYKGQTNTNTGEVEVLGYGTIPDKTIGDMPGLGVSEFVTEIDGRFDVNPFDLID